MRIRVNVDAIGKNTDEYIESKLEGVGLPTCLGSMVPPIISRQAELEETTVLIAKEAVGPKEIVVENPSEIIDSNVTYYEGKVIHRQGAENIEKYKDELSDKYIAQLLKCTKCTIADKCYKLTKNYLQIISIQEMSRFQEMIKRLKDI